MIDKFIKQFTEVIDNLPFNRVIGLKLKKIETDHIVMKIDMQPDLIGNFLHGILHGGVIASVLDMAGGTAAMITAAQKKSPQNIEELAAALGKASTINLHVDYIAPGKGTHFYAKAKILRSGNKIVFTRMDMHNQDDLLIAAGNAAYLIG